MVNGKNPEENQTQEKIAIDYNKLHEDCWEHARHQELQRLSFTRIYSILAIGTLAYLSSEGGVITDSLDYSKTILLVFLLMFSILGYFLICSWNVAFAKFKANALLIAKEYLQLPNDIRKIYAFKKGTSISLLWVIFYSIMINLFLILLILNLLPQETANSLKSNFFWLMLAGLMIFCLLMYVYEKYFVKVIWTIYDKFVNRNN